MSGFPSTPSTTIVGPNDAVIIEIGPSEDVAIQILNSLEIPVAELTIDGTWRTIGGYFLGSLGGF